jgi:HPt (histidine-containing phosphotransfer) domain-containing protein
MGGLEAAARIWVREHLTGRHLPIVAMTVRAMKGDREECLAAGRDGYLSKPIQVGQLIAASDAAMPRSPASPSASTPAAADVFDAAAMRERLGEDEQLVRELVELFQEDYPRLLQRVAAAIRSSDPEALRQAAHTLKGSVATFGAQTATRLAKQLEEIGQGSDLTAAEQTYSELAAAVQQLREALDSWLRLTA